MMIFKFESGKGKKFGVSNVVFHLSNKLKFEKK